ncbi:hypothetical protein M3Y95_00883900 [Aphelenchoides besseyi]|nr:hypothetical protein M3Y95_00883900 [Aphelenchoides besseyi]
MTIKMIFVFTVILLPTVRSIMNDYSCISAEDFLDSKKYPNSIIFAHCCNATVNLQWPSDKSLHVWFGAEAAEDTSFEILVGKNCTIDLKSGLDPDNGSWSLFAGKFSGRKHLVNNNLDGDIGDDDNQIHWQITSDGVLSSESSQFNYCKHTEIIGKTEEGNLWTSIGVRVPENVDDFVMQLWIEDDVLREYFPNRPKYVKPQGAPDLECSAFFERSPSNYESYKENRAVIQDPDETELLMDCNSIRQRAYFQTDDLYPEEAEFPIAFARTVFMDYRLIEIDLAALYTPHNFYCYALDAKSPPLFHKRMNALASCFPNVFIAEKKFSMDSKGHNMSYSYNECMLTLSKPEYKWKYLVMLQNHDIPLKTNQELIQIFKWFNGTNDIAAERVQPERINPEVDWSFEAMNFFKNGLYSFADI